ncbi:copper chaperone PCu(A)C [Herbidospora sp. NEAU-GS84]|uniref:Copper chaperone PCu(A)C n=1 Tax=Herbidospora solisilvae TaxID=2696284 RepID=A0A7C9NEY2_9ACTN|nr:copper chaperone PCu(A)C [Herbidospora solisilvae]NAS23155.1 copper chaperone PCu(A)C [Herbidospora solisilvae]
MPVRTWRATLAFLMAACLLPLLPACNPGRRQPSLPQATHGREGLVDGQVGPMRLVHVHILAPPMSEQKAGDDLGLYLTLVNNSDTPQKLDGVSTVHAERVVYRASPGAPRQAVNVTIPARATLSLQEGQNRPHLELLDIHRPLGATPIDVSFRLSTGTITLRIPVLPLSRGAGSSTPTAGPS